MAADTGKQDTKKGGLGVTHRSKCNREATDSELLDRLGGLLKRPDVDINKVFDSAEKKIAEATHRKGAKIMSEKKGQAGPGQPESISWDTLPVMLKPSEAQQLLRISSAAFYRWVNAGKLPGAVRVGKLWRVDRDKLKAWIDSQNQD